MSDDPQQHRPDPRLNLDLPVRISTIDPEIDPTDGKPFFRSSDEVFANVSRSGAFVPTEEPIAAGHRLLVEIEIPDGRRIQAVGRVVWSQRPMSAPPTAPESPGDTADDTVAARAVRKAGIGIQFLTSSSKQLGTLQDFVEQRLADAPASEPARSRRRRTPDLPPSATA